MELLESIGARLRETRESMGKSQTEFAEIAAAAGAPGATRQSQAKYEKGLQAPGVAYLAAIAHSGADVHYIVTGERDYSPPPPLSRDELELVELYRASPLAVRAAVAAALSSGAGKYSGANIGAVHEKAPKNMTIKQEFNTKKDR